MIVDSDNVLLLRPLTGAVGPESVGGEGLIRVAIYQLHGVDPAAFAQFFAARMQKLIESAGGHVVAAMTTETATNNFPRLPVREQDRVFLWIGRFSDEAAERAFTRKWAATSGWRDGIADALLPALMQKPEVLRLVPSIALPDA